MNLTKEQAQVLIDAHDIRLDEDDEETELLLENNSELYEAYQALISIAAGD